MDRNELLEAARTAASVAVFESGAFGYAMLTRDPSWREHCAELATLAQVKSGEKVLDLGCGPGISAFGMLDQVPDLQITGLDMSRAMLFFAKFFRNREKNGSQVEFVRADATTLPFPDASFDAVTAHSFLYIVPRPDLVLAEVRRVLKPGGRAVFLEPSSATFPKLLPPELLAGAKDKPRFTLAMALWRFYSRTYGRFDEERFASLFSAANLPLVECRQTLAGVAIFGIAERKAD